MKFLENEIFRCLMMTWLWIGLAVLGEKVLFNSADLGHVASASRIYLLTSEDPSLVRQLLMVGVEVKRAYHILLITCVFFTGIILAFAYWKLRQSLRLQRPALAAFALLATIGCAYLPFGMADLMKGGLMSEYAEAIKMTREESATDELDKHDLTASGEWTKYSIIVKIAHAAFGILLLTILASGVLFLAANIIFFALSIPRLREKAGLPPKRARA